MAYLSDADLAKRGKVLQEIETLALQLPAAEATEFFCELLDELATNSRLLDIRNNLEIRVSNQQEED